MVVWEDPGEKSERWRKSEFFIFLRTKIGLRSKKKNLKSNKNKKLHKPTNTQSKLTSLKILR